MENLNAEKDLIYIKDMIEKTKSNSASHWKYFLLWGCAIILGIVGMHLLVFFEFYNYIWLNWAISMGGAGLIKTFIFMKKGRESHVKTYAQNSIGLLSFSMGIAFILTAFILPMMKIYSYDVIPIIIAVLTGVLIFTIGGILEWNYLKWSGVVWLFSSIVMAKIHWHYRSLFLIPLIILSYIIPAIILRKKYKND